MSAVFDIDAIDFAKGDGLVPAIVQHARDGAVLMLGYMNREAVEATIETRAVTFWSRSRQSLWRKGETSGHTLDLVDLRLDCDRDTLLVRALPNGPVCHTGSTTCFDGDDRVASTLPRGCAAHPIGFLAELDALVAQRASDRPAGSYTTKLFERGIAHIAQKVGEEGVETALAAVTRDDSGLIEESADLVFHLIVLLRARGLSIDAVIDRLAARHAAR